MLLVLCCLGWRQGSRETPALLYDKWLPLIQQIWVLGTVTALPWLFSQQPTEQGPSIPWEVQEARDFVTNRPSQPEREWSPRRELSLSSAPLGPFPFGDPQMPSAAKKE
jgi:hypothetical protein